MINNNINNKFLSELTFNENLFINHQQTIDYQDFLKIRKTNVLYKDILFEITLRLRDKEIDNFSNRELVDRILSFYLIPQNYNNLTYGSLYHYSNLNASPDKFRGKNDTDILLKNLVSNEILIKVEKNSHTYYIFTDDIHKLIKREYGLLKLGL